MTSPSSSICLLLLALIATGCAIEANADGSINHVVMGDWGGQDTAPYTTQQERVTAKGMGQVAEKLSATQGLALGDNFYSSGVKSVDSPRFQTTFEDVFVADALKYPFVFNVIAGNHDHRGNVSAQIAYTQRSQRWHFPSEYYSFNESTADGDATLQYVMIDTVELCGSSSGMAGDDEVDLLGRELPGPADAVKADAQWAWINETLAASTADFLVVAGHYPVYSICEHGPTTCLRQRLEPMLNQYKVTAYFNGHDHCAEHLKVGDVDYHVIGSAHENNPSTAHRSTQYTPKGALLFHKGLFGDGGFASVTASASDGFVVEHYNGNGATLYTAPARKARQLSLSASTTTN
jgi:tartrate-resistant acid phosphatase type 5